MTTPPDDLAFMALFETKPLMLDPDVPWIYNTATYETERNGCLVKLQISPSYSTLKVTITVGGHEVAEAELDAFTELEIQVDGGRETLVARFGDLNASALYLTLKPRVRLSVSAGSDS